MDVVNGMHSVMFETDCKFVADTFALPNIPLNELEDIIYQCRSLLPTKSVFGFVIEIIDLS